MPTPAEIAERFEQLSSICLALPQVECERMGRHAKFSVSKKIFLYFVDDHHGDRIVALNCKVMPGENTALVAAQPKRFYMPAYIGHRGWVGLRLDGRSVDWDEVNELVRGSYLLTAAKKLAAQIS